MDLQDVMGNTVTVYSAVAKDKYGKRSHEATGEVISNCRIQYKVELKRDLMGKEIPTIGKVYALGDVSVSIGDKIVLPTGATPVIAMIEKPFDETGAIDHTVIYLTNASA